MLLKSSSCFLRCFTITLFSIVFNNSGSIAVENQKGLSFAPSILKHFASIAEWIFLDGSLFDLSGIFTIENGNESLLTKKSTWNFPTLILISNSNA